MTTLIISGLALAICSTVLAESVEKTITGEGACARCILKEKDAQGHQITVTDTAGGNAVTYYLMPNDVTKQFGSQLCKGAQKITATGTVKMVNGKLEMTPSKIELVKN